MSKGELGTKFYIVKKGIVKIYNLSEGVEIWRKLYYRGDYFGESGIVGKKPRLASAKAIT